MDWKTASAELSKKLDGSLVKSRKQGGGNVSYIEGWHAIAEMNRIFGFGAWDRLTVDIRQLGEPRAVDGKQRVDYMARVRITVQLEDGCQVIRDGCGFGQGIDRDVGQAHESALKEAETDAMKRAMMTFGNPFGLALYDKSRENVEAGEPEKKAATDPKVVRLRLKTALLDALKQYGAPVSANPKFQHDLKTLRADAPEMAAEVDVALEKFNQDKEAA